MYIYVYVCVCTYVWHFLHTHECSRDMKFAHVHTYVHVCSTAATIRAVDGENREYRFRYLFLFLIRGLAGDLPFSFHFAIYGQTGSIEQWLTDNLQTNHNCWRNWFVARSTRITSELVWLAPSIFTLNRKVENSIIELFFLFIVIIYGQYESSIQKKND